MAEGAETVDIPVDEAPKDVEIDVGGNKSDTLKPSVDVDQQQAIADLKKQIEQQRIEAQRRAADSQREVITARQQVESARMDAFSTRKDAIGAAIEALKQQKESAKRDLKLARDSGDVEKEADAFDRISAANARMVEAEKGRMALEEVERAPPQQVQQRQEYVDPGELTARNAEASGDYRAAQWLRAHPDIARDRPRIEAAHNYAVARGAAVSSDEYFKLAEEALGLNEQQPRTEEKPRPPMAAPVNRDVAMGSKRPSDGRITLSPSEVDQAITDAHYLFPNLDPGNDVDRRKILEGYARNKLQLQSEGKI
jgi:hypothetical protein